MVKVLTANFLDHEYFTLKIPRAEFLLDFQIIGTKMFGKALSILKIYIKMEGMVNIPPKKLENMKNHRLLYFFINSGIFPNLYSH